MKTYRMRLTAIPYPREKHKERFISALAKQYGHREGWEREVYVNGLSEIGEIRLRDYEQEA